MKYNIIEVSINFSLLTNQLYYFLFKANTYNKIITMSYLNALMSQSELSKPEPEPKPNKMESCDVYQEPSSWEEALKMSIDSFRTYVLGADNARVLLNGQFGGFNFSDEFKKTHEDSSYEHADDGFGFANITARSNPELVQAVEKFGIEGASGSCCSMRIKSISSVLLPFCSIHEYDGAESVDSTNSLQLFQLKVMEVMFEQKFLRDEMHEVFLWMSSLKLLRGYDRPLAIVER